MGHSTTSRRSSRSSQLLRRQAFSPGDATAPGAGFTALGLISARQHTDRLSVESCSKRTISYHGGQEVPRMFWLQSSCRMQWRDRCSSGRICRLFKNGTRPADAGKSVCIHILFTLSVNQSTDGQSCDVLQQPLFLHRRVDFDFSAPSGILQHGHSTNLPAGIISRFTTSTWTLPKARAARRRSRQTRQLLPGFRGDRGPGPLTRFRRHETS
jgi:hypothetical protein